MQALETQQARVHSGSRLGWCAGWALPRAAQPHHLRVLPQHIAPAASRQKLLCRQNCKDKHRHHGWKKGLKHRTPGNSQLVILVDLDHPWDNRFASLQIFSEKRFGVLLLDVVLKEYKDWKPESVEYSNVNMNAVT